MPPIVGTRATLDDLYREESKAELINGRIVRFMASGRLPSRVALAIATRLQAWSVKNRSGEAFGDGIGYAVPELPSGRESFSPDASYYAGPPSENEMRFIDGPPTFAVGVRIENDYGPAAEAEQAAKRADYFAAGTHVVWDVDPLARCVYAYRRDDPSRPKVYRAGDIADAEPAAPGWHVAVDELFL